MDEKAAKLTEIHPLGADIIEYFIIVQALAFVLLAAVILAFVWQYCKYRKIKRLYRADYAKASCLKSIIRLLPHMPGNKSKRYRNTQKLIIDSGLKISVEGFYLIKTLLFVLGFVFFISIQTTNTIMLYDSIISDMNTERTLLDAPVFPDAESRKLERTIFKHVDASLPNGKVSLKELKSRENSQIYIEYIEAQIRSKWAGQREDAAAAAKRMYKKLIKAREIEKDYFTYFTSLAAAIFLYFMPNMFGKIKLKLIEDKRDWEVLNCIYVFSIFGRMPPFNIKNVLSNILVVSDIYKPLLTEALNSIKSGKGETAFDSLLQRVENEELYELFEAMRLSMSTGLLNIADNIDEMAASQVKWLEIKSIKRRKAKQVIAMVPVVLAMLIAVVYFSYSLSILSNPMNFIK